MTAVLLTFDRDHTHAGQPIARGAIRELPQSAADWLIAHRVAHPTPPAMARKRRGGSAVPPEEDTENADR
jgi:hypothetical protein